MFWLWFSYVLVPSLCFYKYINRDGDALSVAMMTALVVFGIQTVLVFVGDTVAMTISVLIFVFGLFLGYGAWYMPRHEKRVVIPKGEVIRFEYIDAKLGRSSRQVRVTDCDNTYINGRCLTRNADRTFKRNRIVGDVIVESTGEIISPCAPAFPKLHRN